MSEQNKENETQSQSSGGILSKFLNMPNDSTAKIIIMTVSVCLVCAIVVSGAAISLRSIQEDNRLADKRKNILLVAGLDDASKSINERFEEFETRIVDLKTGLFTDEIDPEEFDQKAAADNPELSKKLSPDEDIAKIVRRENYAQVYILRNDAGQIDKLILPVKGYGLWSTLYGFVALESDFKTVYRLKFYEHKETPGLGGEVDNTNWLAQWNGKKLFNEQGEFEFEVMKGSVDKNAADAQYKVDGLAGATLTSIGVTNLFKFWMGEQGFGPFLENLKNNSAGQISTTTEVDAQKIAANTQEEVKS